jgi:hypothetical protein
MHEKKTKSKEVALQLYSKYRKNWRKKRRATFDTLERIHDVLDKYIVIGKTSK